MQGRGRAVNRTAAARAEAVRRLEERLVPILGGLLPLLLVAALTVAVALPRHEAARGVAGLLPPPPPAGVEPGPSPAPPGEPVVVTPDAEEVPDPADEPPEQAAPPEDPPALDDAADGPIPEGEPAEPAEEPTFLAAAEPAAEAEPTPAEPEPAPAEPEPAPAEPQPAAATPAPAPAAEPEPDAEPEPAPEPAPQPQRDERSDSERIFAQEFPDHAAARQTDDPATQSWAVLVGVNRYQGRTQDTLGSVADVLVLREVLLRRGWRDDHILVLTDHTATHDRIVRGIEWLARSTDERSTVVFSFSGHMKHANGATALWPADNRFLWGPDLGRLLGSVPAGRLWATLQGCHSEGLRAPGLEGPGRIVTYSSRLAEKSYEDPDVGHSVQGFYLFAEGLRDRWGDEDGDGRVSVQEGWRWAAPRSHARTANRQTPIISDGSGGRPFHLEVGS